MVALVQQLWFNGRRQFGLYYQLDEDGRGAAYSAHRGLALHGVAPVGEATYRAGGPFQEHPETAVEHLQRAGCEVVLCIAEPIGAAAFVATARRRGWRIPVGLCSLTDPEALLERLADQPETAAGSGLVTTQVVPSYHQELPGVAEYRRLMDLWNPTLPEPLNDPQQPLRRYSFSGLEGYLSAQVVVAALRRAGPELNRGSFRAAVAELGDLDLGLDVPLHFATERLQASDEIYYARIEENRWVPVSNWYAALQVP